MMRSRWNRWPSRVAAAVLTGGLVLATYGGGITPAAAQDRDKHDHDKDAYSHQNPFKQILDKLNEIQAKLKGGGGGGAGSYTLRWDTNNPSASRFTVLTDFNNAAVRDNNTGLVWEQNPIGTTDWKDARQQCIEKSVGGTRGWRLPSVAELVSLIDPLSGAPFVPMSVFTGVQVATPYWSSTADGSASSPYSGSRYTLDFSSGQTGQTSKSSPASVWCVRGPMNDSVY